MKVLVEGAEEQRGREMDLDKIPEVQERNQVFRKNHFGFLPYLILSK